MTVISFLHSKFVFVSLSAQIKWIFGMYKVHYKLAG